LNVVELCRVLWDPVTPQLAADSTFSNYADCTVFGTAGC